MSLHYYVAVDLGAESGRIMLGTLQNGRVALEEIHRFPTGSTVIEGTLRWNVLRIFEEIKAGLKKVGLRGISPEGISVDSWGVDYVLFREGEPLLSVPFHYRDSRTDGWIEKACARVPESVIFEETGIQFMTINTLYQFLDDQERRPDVVKLARQFLNIGDYFNYLLSGVAKAEESLASTTQLYNPRTRDWSKELIQRFELPEQIFPEIVPSGTRLGPLLPELKEEFGMKSLQVVATCSHDTGAAVAAVPAQGKDWAYLSSGTWSLLGVEMRSPVITEASRRYNFTNEEGFGGTTRLLKNLIGLWIVQECRRAWQKEGKDYSYEDLTRLASEAKPLRFFINPNAQRFIKPDNMPDKVAAYCRETGQEMPKTPGEIIRCVNESLALLYRRTVEQMEEVSERRIERLHIVGGGSKSDLLNQFTANALKRPVIAGPVEGTALGNVLIQAIALGHLPSLQALRDVVAQSFPGVTYQPQDTAAWDAAYHQFNRLNVKI